MEVFAGRKPLILKGERQSGTLGAIRDLPLYLTGQIDRHLPS